jgi:hypothetical protein
MPVGDQDHGGVSVTRPISFGHVYEPLNPGLNEVLARPQVSVWAPLGRNCPVSDGWRYQPQVLFARAFRAPCGLTVRTTAVLRTVMPFRGGAPGSHGQAGAFRARRIVSEISTSQKTALNFY